MGFLDRIFGRSRGTAAKQEADPQALSREDDPRGGLQSEEYRSADPRDVVEEGGTVMSGPAGAPQDGTTPEERRREQRDYSGRSGSPEATTRRPPTAS